MSAAGDPSNALTPGTVVGAPGRWLRLEAFALLAATAIAYPRIHQPWWLIPATFLIPDLFAVGYLHGPRTGTRIYNIVHATPLPAILLTIAVTQHQHLLGAVGLIWLMHIALDRLLGFGLKYPDQLGHTHLSQPTPQSIHRGICPARRRC